MTIRAYCAGSWQSRGTVDYRAKIIETRAGWEITSRWHKEGGTLLDHSPDVFAPADIEDMEKAKRIVWIGDDPVSPGKHFEMGYAWARRWPIYVIGEGKQRCGFIPPDVVMTWEQFIDLVAKSDVRRMDDEVWHGWFDFLGAFGL